MFLKSQFYRFHLNMVNFIHLIIYLIISYLPQFLSQTYSDFYNPPKTYSEQIQPVNLFATIPCTVRICDNEYGCFDPAFFTLYTLTLPPISGCPEVPRKKLIRFFTITRKKPDLFQTVNVITSNSDVAIYIHGILEEYNEVPGLTVVGSLLNNYDAVVLVDTGYLANSYVIENIPFPVATFAITDINSILEGRVICKFIYTLKRNGQINFNHLKVIGFSAGANSLAYLANYCRLKYDIIFPHFVALETSAFPLRYSNYKLTDEYDAKVVDVLYTTHSQYLFGLEQSDAYLDFQLGPFERLGRCTYIINPNSINIEQPACPPRLIACSHLNVNIVFAAAESGKCRFRYSPCPIEFGLSSSSTGFTQFNCKKHDSLYRTCVRSSPFPLLTC